MPGPASNRWKAYVVRMLRGGWITVPEASMMAGVVPSRIWHWCRAAGFNPAAARDRRVSIYYARELLAISLRDRIKSPIAPSIKAKVPRRKPRKRIDKTVARAEIDAKVIDFAKAGGKIKRIPKGKRTLRPL